MRVAAVSVFLSEERAQLTQWAPSKTVSVRLSRRAQIVLGAADGLDNETIAAQLGLGRVQVGRWRTRYTEGGLAAIQQDLPRGGRPVKVDAAQLVGVSDTTVLRVWRQHGLKPHRVRVFKVSRDPQFIEKLKDIVGMYMAPPEHALVLRREEPSPGTGSHATWVALEEGARGDDDARLQAQRHDHVVRGAQRTRWPGHRPVSAAASPRRMAEVPAPDRA